MSGALLKRFVFGQMLKVRPDALLKRRLDIDGEASRLTCLRNILGVGQGPEVAVTPPVKNLQFFIILCNGGEAVFKRL